MRLCGKASDAAFWRQLCDENPAVPAELTALLLRQTALASADRAQKRQILSCTALLCLLYPGDAQYSARLEDAIRAVCGETSWCAADCAEDAGVSDEGFAQTTISLAEIWYLVGDRLDSRLGRDLKTQLKRRVLDGYLEKSAPWERGGSSAAVGTACVGCTVMLLFPDLFEKLLARFDASIAAFLAGKPAANTYFSIYAELLRDFTGGGHDCTRWKNAPQTCGDTSPFGTFFSRDLRRVLQ